MAIPWLVWQCLAIWGDFPPSHGSPWSVCPALAPAPQFPAAGLDAA
ncbi:hypothetical protein SynMEDNS5_01840 [Synechococcus sp. MEDNS5]|nr:hypothetical protein SynMEDNS5_01840 [Synechococcus sp. MEDNS5]